MKRLVTALAVLAGSVLCVLVAGTASSARQTTPLEKVLGDVRLGPASREAFEWSDMAAVRKLLGLPPNFVGVVKARVPGRWITLTGIARGAFDRSIAEAAVRSGIDTFAADRLVTIGVPPHRATLLAGEAVDAAKIERALRANGSKPRKGFGGRTYLANGEEGSLRLDGKLERDLGVLSDLDRAFVRPHTAALGPYEEPIDELLGGRPALTTSAPHHAAAACLGETINALLWPAALLRAPAGVVLDAYGIRVHGSRTGPVDEILCVVDRSADAAKRHAGALRKFLHGVEPSTRRRWSELIASVSVRTQAESGLQTVQAVVRLKKSTPVGLVLRALYEDGIGVFLG